MPKLTSAYLYQLVSVCVLVVVMFLVARYVPVIDSIAKVEQVLEEAGVAAPIAYPLIIAVCNLLLMPAGILSVGGGFFFGLWWGVFLVSAGSLIGAAGAFLIGRKLGRKRIERMLRHRSKWAHLDEAIEKDGWKIILLSQLHPLFPVSLINYIYGISSIRFWPCMLWTLLGRLPGIFLYVYLGTLGQFGVNLLRGKSNPTTLEYVFWGGGLVLLFVLTALLGRIALRMLAEAEAKMHLNEPTKLEVHEPVTPEPEHARR
ncbi:MAG: TVP38/TMEM64 family protein [Chthoniobacteraceae bacterium]